MSLIEKVNGVGKLPQAASSSDASPPDDPALKTSPFSVVKGGAKKAGALGTANVLHEQAKDISTIVRALEERLLPLLLPETPVPSPALEDDPDESQVVNALNRAGGLHANTRQRLEDILTRLRV